MARFSRSSEIAAAPRGGIRAGGGALRGILVVILEAAMVFLRPGGVADRDDRGLAADHDRPGADRQSHQSQFQQDVCNDARCCSAAPDLCQRPDLFVLSSMSQMSPMQSGNFNAGT